MNITIGEKHVLISARMDIAELRRVRRVLALCEEILRVFAEPEPADDTPERGEEKP